MTKINVSMWIASLVMLLIAIAFDVNYLDYKHPIEHARIKEITLKDFRGLKRLNENLQGSNEFAFITTQLQLNETAKGETVKAVFHPSRSYIYNENTEGDRMLLTHELYHFNITEYIARKMTKDLAEHPHLTFEDIISNYQEEEYQLQRLYDKETNHSYFVGKQIKWQEKIDSLLLKLDNYKTQTSL